MAKLTIGRVAERAGVGVETIRFYQRLGLVGEPVKPPGGFRAYPEETVERVSFIKRAQNLGFSLAEIGQLLRLEEPQSCARTHDLALKKLAAVEERLADLTRIRATLRKLVNACETTHGRVACPIISSLATPQPARGSRRAR